MILVKITKETMRKVKLTLALLISATLLAGCSASQIGNKTEITPEPIKYDVSKLRVEQPSSKSQPLNNDSQNSMDNSNPKNFDNLDPNKFENLVKDYHAAIIKTNQGDITVTFYNTDSPFTVNNFLNLAKLGFYNQTKFHRVIKDFMIQGGDPNSKDDDWTNDGMGGPTYRFADEFNSNKLVKGSLAMANSGADTNGSQFFIVTAAATTWLDGKHTNFGMVTSGLDVVTKIENLPKNQNDHPTTDAIILNIELLK